MHTQPQTGGRYREVQTAKKHLEQSVCVWNSQTEQRAAQLEVRLKKRGGMRCSEGSWGFWGMGASQRKDVRPQSSAPLSRLTPGLSVHTNTRLLSTAERLMRCGRRSELTTHFDGYKWSCSISLRAAEDDGSVLLWKKQAGCHGREKIWSRAVFSLKSEAEWTSW